MGTHANVKEEQYREDSPGAQLQEGLNMQMELGAGLCDVNRQLVDYYSGGSSAGGGSVNGDAGGLDYEDVESYVGAGMSSDTMSSDTMSSDAMSAGAMSTYNQQPAGYTFDVGGYGRMMSSQGMIGNINRMGGHDGQDMMMPRSHASSPVGISMGTQQYQSMGQGYDGQGGSESPLLVE